MYVSKRRRDGRSLTEFTRLILLDNLKNCRKTYYVELIYPFIDLVRGLQEDQTSCQVMLPGIQIILSSSFLTKKKLLTSLGIVKCVDLGKKVNFTKACFVYSSPFLFSSSLFGSCYWSLTLNIKPILLIRSWTFCILTSLSGLSFEL